MLSEFMTKRAYGIDNWSKAEEVFVNFRKTIRRVSLSPFGRLAADY